jgi:hypothetical protein
MIPSPRSRQINLASAALIVLLAVVPLLPSVALPQQRLNRPHSRSIGMSAEILQIDSGTCLYVTGRFDSGDFFAGLEAHENKHVIEFRKDKQTYATFSPEITLHLSIIESFCRGPNPRPLVLAEGQKVWDFIHDLRISVEWKHETELRPRPASILSNENFTAAKEPVARNGPLGGWECTLRVNSQDVPLTDHLVVNLLGPDGKRIARISGHL